MSTFAPETPSPTLTKLISGDTFGPWSAQGLAKAVGATEQRIHAYLRGASWPFEDIYSSVGSYVTYVSDGDPDQLRQLLPTTVGADGHRRGYDPALDVTFYGPLSVADLSQDVQRRATAVAVDVSEGRNIDHSIMRIYLSRIGSTSGLHWDGRPASLVQLHGTKHGVLFPPGDTALLSPFPEDEGPNSELDPFDSAAIPEAARPAVFMLEPGDVLDIPRGWWHCFRAATETSTSLSIWWPEVN